MHNPWDNNPDWQPPFTSNAKNQLYSIWGMSLLWNLIALPLSFILPAEIAAGNYAAAAGFMFPAIGLGFIYWAIKVTREFRTFGITELNLDPYPGSIGGHVGGIVTLPEQAGTEANYTATLICVRSVLRRSGGKSKRREQDVWRISGSPTVQTAGRGIELGFRFSVPVNLPHSEEHAVEYHFWKVVLESDHTPIALNRAFEIPVFATKSQARYLATDSAALAAVRAQDDIESAFINQRKAQTLRAKLGLSLEVRADWVRLYFHRGRQKGIALMMLLVGVPFMAIYWLPDEETIATVFRYLFSGVGLTLSIAALYLPFNTLDVRVSRHQISRVRRWLGVVLKRQTITPSDLTHIKIEKGALSTTNNKKVQYYRLVGTGSFGKFRFAETIDDLPLLEALALKINDFAGLTGK